MRTCLELDRNLVHAHSYIGLGKALIRRAEETEIHVGEALRLSPRDTVAYVWMSIAVIAKSGLCLWDQAILWSRRAIEANRNYPHSYFWLAAALAHLGRLDEARSAVMTGLALNPAFTIFRARADLDGDERQRRASRRTSRPFSKRYARPEQLQ